MATDQYPQRNHNIPMKESALDAARAKLNPGSPGPGTRSPNAPYDGKGSRREVRPGEWVDDRVIIIGGPASPSEGTPPDLRKGKALPTFDPGKIYHVTLGQACVFAGRTLTPANVFYMTGDTCLDPAVNPCITDAVVYEDIPVEPDAPPSMAPKP
jgi:hypothetical protein